MVARIRSGKSLKGAINYNEKKVSEGKAVLIEARLYPKAHDRLYFHEKLSRLQNLAALNTRTATNCLHVSLNFDPTEQLSNERLIQIAEDYMKGINFPDQPYLVYRHYDAAHQHIHIVSTNIKKDGKRIPLHNLGRTVSEKVRREIEINYGLIRASDKQERKMQPLNLVNLKKLQYGKVETKRAISNIVGQVVSQYSFGSLPEFNAILQLFGVTADRGAEGSRMFEKRGLQYSLLDEKLNKIGVPIKASSIYGKPTLNLLESKFEEKKRIRASKLPEVQAAVRLVLAKSSSNDSFAQNLREKGIDLIWRKNEQNFIYGVTYVDHTAKVVFNGSDLAKEFSAAALRSRWKPDERAEEPRVNNAPAAAIHKEQTNKSSSQNPTDLVTILIQSANTFDYVPYALKKKRRKKRGKSL